MVAMIFSVIGLMVWIIGIVWAVMIMFDKSIYVGEDSRVGVACLFLLVVGIMGSVLGAYGLWCPVRDIRVVYEVPTTLFKTNGIVYVTHKVGNDVKVSGTYMTTDWWLATNIMVEVESGKNFYGVDVGSSYGIVLK